MQQASDPAMSFDAQPSGNAPDAIAELEALLCEEAAALSRLDVEAIDAVSERKLQLLPALQSLEADGADAARLVRIREKAIRNQLLTVHARDTVGSIIGAVVPHADTSYPPAQARAPRPGFKVNVKG
jgi:hypothetical protein